MNKRQRSSECAQQVTNFVLSVLKILIILNSAHSIDLDKNAPAFCLFQNNGRFAKNAPFLK